MLKAPSADVCLRVFVSSVSFVCFLLIAGVASAQPADAFGVRAQGMGGAFTAVADDATATWWNPAGLATGAFFSSVVEIGHDEEPKVPSTPAWRTSSRAFTTAYPALGVSYYRLRISEIQPLATIAASGAGREDQRTGDVRLRSLALNQFGATVGQSVGTHFVLASTLKLLRGSLAADVRAPADASLDEAERLDGNGETHLDLDVGAMARFGPATVGLMVRNVSEPTFGAGDSALTLTRAVRVGAALSSVTQRSVGAGVTVAADADLTTAMTALGDERRAGVGIEAWSHARQFGIRGGVSASTLSGDRRASVSGGFSFVVKKGSFVDLAATRGGDAARNGWGIGLRVTF